MTASLLDLWKIGSNRKLESRREQKHGTEKVKIYEVSDLEKEVPLSLGSI